MQGKKLPPGLHRDTLAVRAAIEPSQYGENSEALYLTSGFLQPDSETMARRFANPDRATPTGAPPIPRSPASSSGSRRWKGPKARSAHPPAWARS
jgi:O-succinylhomoserine sulfhydrylase